MSVFVTVPDQRLATALSPLPDGVDLAVWPMDGPAPRPHIDLVVTPYLTGRKVLTALEGVTTTLVQSQSIGYDGVADALPSGHRYANASSVHEASTAELTLALILASQRGIADDVRHQDREEWTSSFQPSLADRRVLILGYGGVGKAIEARLEPFEVELIRVASHAREEGGRPVHGVDELAELLPSTDILVVALPGGDSTRHIIDADALALLPDGALVVNIGRGPLVDTDALVAELQAGRLRAALDVTDPEPLPKGHPLWSAPGTLITPHVGGATSAMLPRVVKLLRTQIDRILAGEEPLNIVIGA